MKAIILHESKGRIRFRISQKKMTLQEADVLENWFQKKSWITQVTVHERTGCVILQYSGSRKEVLAAIREFNLQEAQSQITLPLHSSRELNRKFQEKLVGKVVLKAASMLFLPKPLRIARIVWHMLPFLKRGIRCILRGKLKVDVLDALSIGISVFRKDFGTAGTVILLLELGELLEKWTRKKSMEDLARCMALNVDRVWLKTPESEILTAVSDIRPGDKIVIRAGSMIPMDGILAEGEVTVNQASLTGESVPVVKHQGSTVYAGTVVEEGECILEVKQVMGSSRYDQIVTMIEKSEQMKSAVESKAANLADKLVPYTFIGSILSFLLTRNILRALSVLMVDFSCALKFSMPLAVLSAMREAGKEHITVKGGKFLEAVAAADTIVFDKTGTLTHACPRVAQIIAFGGRDESEMLRLAACLEEHFPHSIANAVVQEAQCKGLSHEELHSKVEYLVAHGIASTVNEEEVLIGSAHFIFEDEGVTIPLNEQERFDHLPEEYSHLYLAIGGELAAVICISDPLRSEAKEVLTALRALGIQKTVMLTGDSYRTASAVANRLGVDTFCAEVLPADKAKMIGDETEVSIIVPEGKKGHAYLITDNFRKIMVWNRSENYALAVGILADYIKSGKKWKPVSQHEAVKVKTDDVLKVQAFLNKIGWEELDEDGKLGAKTREAIKKVQKKARMPQDGYPDYQFLQKINNYNPKVGFSVPVQPKKSAKPDVQKKKQSLRTDKNKLN